MASVVAGQNLSSQMVISHDQKQAVQTSNPLPMRSGTSPPRGPYSGDHILG